jgi:hypothetical protein
VVPGNSFQSIESSYVNAPKFDPASQHWRAMTANSDATLETYRASSSATRKETRRVLDAAMFEVQLQGSEVQALAYLIGRLDEIDAEHHKPQSRQSE